MNRYLAAGLCCVCVVAAASAQSRELQVLQNAVHQAIDEAEPSVASILVSRSDLYREFNTQPAGAEGKLGGFEPPPAAEVIDPARAELIHRLNLADPHPIPESYGGGVVLDKSGLILTHFHIIQNATKVYVRFPKNVGSYADIWAADGRSDLAVLKLINPPPDLKPIRLGDGDRVRKGDFIVGICSPFVAGGACSPVAAHGIIGNIRFKPPSRDRSRADRINQYGTLLQTYLPAMSNPDREAPKLNLVCSGGAVVNLAGELVALSSTMPGISPDDAASGFAVPLTSDVRRIVDVLLRGEEVEYGMLGIAIANETDTGFLRGAVIERVQEGYPAKRAGLRDREVITAIGNTPIRDNDDLFLHVGAALAGSQVTLTVNTLSGSSRKVTLRLAKFTHASPVIAARRPAPVFGLSVTYSSIAPADWPVPEGAFIRDVERGSPADKKFKDLFERARWIVTAVNGKRIATPAEFYKEAAAANGSLELKLAEVGRGEFPTRTITLP